MLQSSAAWSSMEYLLRGHAPQSIADIAGQVKLRWLHKATEISKVPIIKFYGGTVLVTFTTIIRQSFASRMCLWISWHFSVKMSKIDLWVYHDPPSYSQRELHI